MRAHIKNCEKGMSLIEIMIAVAVFTIAVLGAAHLFIGPHQASADNLDKNQATLLAREGIEAIRSMPYSQVRDAVDEEEGYTLIFRGNLEEMANVNEVEAWFEWSVGGGSDFIKTDRQTLTDTGFFSDRKRISMDEIEDSYDYRAVMEYDGVRTTGELKTIYIDLDND